MLHHVQVFAVDIFYEAVARLNKVIPHIYAKYA